MRLFGGADGQADYIALPDTVLNGLTDATFEIWATREGFQQWSRIFDFGPNDSNFFTAVWSVELGSVLSAVQWKEQDFETGDFTITDGDEVNLAVTMARRRRNFDRHSFQDGSEQRSFVVNATLADLVSDRIRRAARKSQRTRQPTHPTMNSGSIIAHRVRLSCWSAANLGQINSPPVAKHGEWI